MKTSSSCARGTYLIFFPLQGQWRHHPQFHQRCTRQLVPQWHVCPKVCMQYLAVGCPDINILDWLLKHFKLLITFRLYIHILSSKGVMTRKNRLIEYLARKSLICFILTFIFNLAMNLLKVTTFLGNRSDVSTRSSQI